MSAMSSLNTGSPSDSGDASFGSLLETFATAASGDLNPALHLYFQQF